jgi:SAM-dependent methyltransferase
MDLSNERIRALFFELHEGLPRQGPGRNRYTARAFGMIQSPKPARTLDIGCGPGTPTLELARQGSGHVVGIDTHLPFLHELLSRATDAGLSEHITAVCASMEHLPFPDGSFDLFWAEGSIYNMGFERGLRAWRSLLRPGGSGALHEVAWLRPDPPEEAREFWEAQYPGMKTVEECRAIIARCGYECVAHFALPPDAWWDEYYGPLEQKILTLRKRYAGDAAALAVLDEEAVEVALYRRYGEYYGAVFFVLRRKESA